MVASLMLFWKVKSSKFLLYTEHVSKVHCLASVKAPSIFNPGVFKLANKFIFGPKDVYLLLMASDGKKDGLQGLAVLCRRGYRRRHRQCNFL